MLKNLASPVIGEGINISRVHRIFLLAMQEGKKDPIVFAWDNLKRQEQTLSKGGKAREREEANLVGLKDRYETFVQKALRFYGNSLL